MLNGQAKIFQVLFDKVKIVFSELRVGLYV